LLSCSTRMSSRQSLSDSIGVRSTHGVRERYCATLRWLVHQCLLLCHLLNQHGTENPDFFTMRYRYSVVNLVGVFHRGADQSIGRSAGIDRVEQFICCS
jgi:hypothetical protein